MIVRRRALSIGTLILCMWLVGALVPIGPTSSLQRIPIVQAAPCAGGPTIDDITLDECMIQTFEVNGNERTITVWYTKDTTTATREVDGSTLTLEHWITSDAQAQDVADFAELAWQSYFADSGGVEPFIDGCSDNLNIQLEDGVGWAGVAYWASSGNCNIGIDAPMIRNGVGNGDGAVITHEVQHYLQYAYNDGCYADWKPNYPDNSEFIEGYADLAPNGINAALDGTTFNPIGYDAGTSFYDKGYNNIFVLYMVEQLGSLGSATDTNYGMDTMYRHYERCDTADTLYVLDSLIPSLSGGALSEQQLFLNFFAANWAESWADPAMQPELTYAEFADSNGSLSPISLTESTSLSSGSQTWSGTTPDDWAANYYQVQPQAGCPYVQVDVDGAAGAQLGINLMAADTVAPTNVLRSAGVGEDFTRTFAGVGVHDRVVAIVNSFHNNYSYDVTFTCVNPQINILEPLQTNFAMVGAPDSPLAFLTRLSVTSGANAVRGLPEADFAFDAEGDALTVVPGTFQEVSGEYWAILRPPTKAAGTTFVDFEVCLDTTICDTENDALLYVEPGNVDAALVFDASGSMAEVDVTGEPSRLQQAQRSGTVVANLLRPGDRLLVTDFSAEDDPPGCGTGAGNCVLDLQTLLPRTDVTAANVTTIIDNAITAINDITAREWTPIGAAVRDAKNKLLATPTNENPKYIYLLSDGRENVQPFWEDVREEIEESGVVVNTIGFGPEAPGDLLAQIASATGGRYRPVATTGDGVGPAQVGSGPRGLLGLAEVYDDFDTEAQDATRLFHRNYANVKPGTYETTSTYVDDSAGVLRFVVAGDQFDSQGFGYIRIVEVQQPGNERWIPISPPSSDIPPPSKWQIRNSPYNDVLIVPNPATGVWQIRTRYDFILGLATADEITLQQTAANFIMDASVQSSITLDGRLLNLTNNTGNSGDVVTIVGTLLNRTGGLSGATVEAEVGYSGGSTTVPLFDDGLHNDGGANDGVYAADFGQTAVGGSYNVTIRAEFDDPANPVNTLNREWNGGFWLNGPWPAGKALPPEDDGDQDTLPDAWEERCDLDTSRDDAGEDPDQDNLTNRRELELGTLPCRADTDQGGERDDSEVNNGRNPLDPQDDNLEPLGVIRILPGNDEVTVRWPNAGEYDRLLGYISTQEGRLGNEVDMGNTGDYSFTGLTNGQTYYLTFVGQKDGNTGQYSQPYPVTPQVDTTRPRGAVLIENGVDTTSSPDVTLYLSATDEATIVGPVSGAGGPTNRAQQSTPGAQVTARGMEMRISNSVTFAGATWEPFAERKAWQLDCAPGENCTVYVQFRDDATPEPNTSPVVSDSIALTGSDGRTLYLPIINR
jgi:hypothetical protein